MENTVGKETYQRKINEQYKKKLTVDISRDKIRPECYQVEYNKIG